MTIAIGFICTDGIVLAADRMEYRGVHKVEVKKIVMRKYGKLSISLAGAGDGELIEQFFAEVAEEMIRPLARRTLKKIIQSATKKMFDQNIKPLGKEDYDRFMMVRFLIAASHSGQSLLYAAGPVQKCRAIGEIHRYHHTIGIGQYAADPLLGNIHSERLSMLETATIAAYILKRVKEQSPDCGGPSDIVLHGSDGTIKAFWPEWGSYTTTKQREEWSESINLAFGKLIQAAARNHNASIDKGLEELRKYATNVPTGDPDDLWDGPKK